MLKRIASAFLFCWALSTPVFGQNDFYSGQNADLMVSGLDFNQTGGPLTFNHPSGVASDGTRFLLCDRFNNRILVWNSLPQSWNTPPDLVLGQPDFSSNDPGTGKHQMNWCGNVSTADGVVAAADTENDRILIWRQFPAANAAPADVSLYLPALSPAGNQMPFAWPWGVWTDGKRLVAVATHGSALLFWNSLPTVDNQSPDYIVQLPEFGTPRNISTDGASYFFVGDHNPKVPGLTNAATFFWNSYPSTSNQPFDFYRPEWIKGVKLADGKLVAGGLANIYVWNEMPTNAAKNPDLTLTNGYYKNGDGVDVAAAGGKIWINNYNGNNVWVFNQTPAGPGQTPDYCIGSSSYTYNTLEDIHYIQNPVVAADGGRLMATSDFDRTLSIWHQLPTQSGQKADLTVSLGNIQVWDNAFYKDKIVVAGRRSFAVWQNVPVAANTPPNLVFNNQVGSVQFQDLVGVALDDQFLYLAERGGAIYIWKGIPQNASVEPFKTLQLGVAPLNLLNSDGEYLTAVCQSSGPTGGAYVFKVSEIAEQAAPQPFKKILSTPSFRFNLPASAITVDGALAMAVNSGNQILWWNRLEDAGDPLKVVVLGQTGPGQMDAAIGKNRLFMPASLAWSGDALWTGEFKFSSRILRFSPNKSTSYEQTDNESSTRIYPNPFTERIFIDGFSGPGIAEVYDASARKILSTHLSDGWIETRHWPSGVYFLKISDKGRTNTFKIIKKREF